MYIKASKNTRVSKLKATLKVLTIAKKAIIATLATLTT